LVRSLAYQGKIDSADSDGVVVNANEIEDNSSYLYGSGRYNWPSWYRWPFWWGHLNGLGKITWKLELKPGVHPGWGWSVTATGKRA